jgi:phage gp29-like protein
MATLYDANGNPITAKDNRPITQRVAVPSMRDNWGTYPSRGLTPQRLARIFREADEGDVVRQMELFSELEEKDARIASALGTRRRAVQGLDWTVAPAAERGKDPTPEQLKIADYVDEVLREIPGLDEWMYEALDAIGKGYSISEILWDLSASQYWIRDLVWVDQRKFCWDQENHQLEPRLVTDVDQMGVPISAYPGSFVYHQHKARSGKPSRGGIVRTCAWMYLFKNYAVKDWVAFCEVFGMPLRLGKFDPGASVEEKDALRMALVQLGSDGAGIISKGTEIEFVEVSSKGSSADLYGALARFANDEITLAILGQLASSQGTPGKLGNDDAQENVREDLRAADARALAKTIREQVIVRLVDFNFGPQDRYPEFKFEYEPEEDLKQNAETLKLLVESGAKIPQSHVREKFGIPEGEKGEEYLVPPSQAQPTPQPEPAKAALKQTAHGCTCAACGGVVGDMPDSVDLVVDEMMGGWEEVLDPLVGELLRRMKAAESWDDVRDILAEAAGDPRVSVKQLQEVMTAGHLAGRALGDVEVRGG